MTEEPKTLKSTHRAVQIMLKEAFATQTWLNPSMFEFSAWNPSGYIVLSIQGKKGSIAEPLFAERSVYVNSVKDLSMDIWRTECEFLVREFFLLQQSKDI